MYTFVDRHTGIKNADYNTMLKAIGSPSITHLLEQAVPNTIRGKGLPFFQSYSEYDTLTHMETLGQQNKVYTSFIGKGYYPTILPSPIRRHILENAGWYTAYTPYQAEISQGRLEAIMNFQTMVCELTKMDIANASLLDEGTASAEGVCMLWRFYQKQKPEADTLLVIGEVFSQTLKVLETRLFALGLKIKHYLNIDDIDWEDKKNLALFIQYPAADGQIHSLDDLLKKASSYNIPSVVAADILALGLINPPQNADVIVGSTQRFGIPMGFGGPHAAFFTVKDIYKRYMPGRMIGLSKDVHGNNCYRMSLQTREQHIKRDRATSNICTSQVLLAIMASMYAVYHGPKGIQNIAKSIHKKTIDLAEALTKKGFILKHNNFFDTLAFAHKQVALIQENLEFNQINIFRNDNEIHISLNETTTNEEIEKLIALLSPFGNSENNTSINFVLPPNLYRQSPFLTQKIFNNYHTETELMRYIKKLERRDISLNYSMIPLGSCTMKLNPATAMLPITWNNWSNIHPMSPLSQTLGYQTLIKNLEDYLKKITHFEAISFQPNSGAQGEYAGLLVIKNFLQAKGQSHRDICIIPASAHGTNPASAVMAGFKVVVIKITEDGEIDIEDLQQKIKIYSNNLAVLMITYPSTHGIYEENIHQVVQLMKTNGALVYMDGANMNAQIGLTSPYELGADVCHLNLHKTFAIPHGGGGPGVGAIGVTSFLEPYLPQKNLQANKQDYLVSSSPWGSALILLISYAYIRMLGSEGLKISTERAILNANYLKSCLEKYYDILYTNQDGKVAHEFIIDCKSFKSKHIDASNIAKRLMDYGFHAPTVSFPVPNSLMIEPTESESLKELDKFVEVMISIYNEIKQIGTTYLLNDNPLINAPHTLAYVCNSQWNHCYTREKAAFALPYLLDNKIWPTVGRIDEAYGDRNLVCSCDPISTYINN